jgi:hypothetical protein
MQVREIPKGDSQKAVDCMFCSGRFTIKEILAFNKISNLSEKRFEGWEHD